MKLIIKQYLSSLKERKELDALLPDLLSQMGLHVFSKPGTGSRQYGVDIAAYGSIDDEEDTVYLFSVKSGNLTRSVWDGTKNDLRSSLNEIKDVYVNNHLPSEYSDKPIKICICVGGEIREQVRLSLTQYVNDNETDKVKYIEWCGDRLASLIDKHLLREELLPSDARPFLRKSLALLDEPEASFKHYSNLIKSLSEVKTNSRAPHIRTIRQLHISLWILFAWARDEGNLESAYLSAERALLYGWELTKPIIGKETKAAKQIYDSFRSILHTYFLITDSFLNKIFPHVDKTHGLSIAVKTHSTIDVNLKMFDLIGRLALLGLWNLWLLKISNEEEESVDKINNDIDEISKKLIHLIENNPALISPIKDENGIEVFLTLLFLFSTQSNHEYMKKWLEQMNRRAIFTYQIHGKYPCILREYRKLIEHPKKNDDYRKDVTKASILYPTIAFWTAILGDIELFEELRVCQQDYLTHCNYQFWYPDETSEKHYYKNDEIHGANLSNLDLKIEPDEFLKYVWGECKEDNFFNELSAVKHGLFPIILVACRHHRMPVPLHFTLAYKKIDKDE